MKPATGLTVASNRFEATKKLRGLNTPQPLSF